MNDFESDNLHRKEVIDGVTVVYTGKSQPVPQGYFWKGGGLVDLGYKQEEIVEMYDSNGNRFYSNFDSIEAANQKIAKFAEEGITAVIGPKAPWRDPEGNLIPNPRKNAVGVFFVQVQEKSDDFSSHRTR